jgi:hypothetical protein
MPLGTDLRLATAGRAKILAQNTQAERNELVTRSALPITGSRATLALLCRRRYQSADAADLPDAILSRTRHRSAEDCPGTNADHVSCSRRATEVARWCRRSSGYPRRERDHRFIVSAKPSYPLRDVSSLALVVGAMSVENLPTATGAILDAEKLFFLFNPDFRIGVSLRI